jgi:hypothetical protein
MKSIVRRHNKTNVKMSRKNKTHKKSSIKRTRTNKYTRMRRRKNRKNKRISKKKIYKGGNNDITCCMCGDKNLTRENTLVPSKCFTEHWNRAHRICEKKCWFQKFAKEGNNHTCPGCIKELPLTNVESTFPNQVIDLTKN